MNSKILTERTSLIFIWLGISILGGSLTLFLFRANLFDFYAPINSELFDRYGSFIGGLVGSLWTLSSIILFYIALTEQRKSTDHQRRTIDISNEALHAQIKSLELQRHELELQRDELKQTREVFHEQSKTLKLQQFESTFFNLLNLHQKNVTSIDVQKLDQEALEEKTITSRDSFVYFYEVFSRCYDTEMKKAKAYKSNMTEMELIDKTFHEFFSQYQSDLGHYWRNLYNILKFIDKKNPEDIFFYSNLLRAQLSSHELLMLFYNCLSHYGDKKFKPLIEKYHFLQTLPRQMLIDMDKQMKLYHESAFGRPDKT